ncbi:glycosyl transferase [Saccharobesus litoralis]|uniref:Glycosyl transferase n=1 Tax=Saccharobesus litoralis TaxID=2172099 RepID=A0A2S0VVL1_9ALTE|nr:glycosyltransferase [Saccharobesus litoralis]AWB68256.1 glycosyl transferase [Saccharobesus litoralis]
MPVIAHIEAGRHLYGGALQVYYLIAELAKSKQYKQVLICPVGSEIGQKCAGLCQVVEIEMKGDLDLAMTARIRKALLRYEVDICHIHSRRGADIWGLLAAKWAGCQTVLTRRVDNKEPNWLASFKYRRFDFVAAISQGIKHVMLQSVANASQVEVIRSAVDVDTYQVTPQKDWFCAEFNFSAQDKVIAIVAQLIKRKGHAVLFEAVEPLLAANPNLKVLVLGQGPLREELEQKVKQRNLHQQIIFAGFRNDLPRVLPNLDIVVHPAFAEGLGVSLLQASACGVPIIASRAGGIPEAVIDGVNGFLVEPGEVNALRDKLQCLLADNNLRQQIAMAGRQLMERDYAISVMANRYHEVYQNLLNPYLNQTSNA